MDEGTFRTYYASTLRVIRDSPKLKAEFGLDPEMDRAEASAQLQKMRKKTLYRVIDAIPDEVIAARFREYVAHHDDEFKGKDLPKEIEIGWKSLQQRLEK
jgi:hypothetical protein